MTPEDAFKHLNSIVEQANAIVSKLYYESRNRADDSDGEEQFFFAPEKGNVAFSSAIDRWAFTLREFAEIYAQKLGVSPKALCSFLWGQFFFNSKTKKVSKKQFADNAEPMFVQFILNPI